MTREDIINRVISLTSVSIEDAEYAADVAGVDDGDDRDFDTLVEDCLNALGF